MGLLTTVRRTWNAFRAEEQTFGNNDSFAQGPASYGAAPPQHDTPRFLNERSIVTAIYTRIAVDVASILIKEVDLDDKGRYAKDTDSTLNRCLLLEPNIDQAPRQFRQNIVMKMIDEGVAAVVPVDMVINPENTADFDILSLRVGEVTDWRPQHVRVKLYNEAKAVREEVTVEKRFVALVENPLYSVMNAPNSTLQRLMRKLHLLDVVDEQSSSGKLDLIIQLPYVIKSEARRQQAENRRAEIEFQLKDSKYGIAYTDGTEKVTQLNRPAENNLLKQVEYLTNMLYDQLGITVGVMNGTAPEHEMLNYHNRTVEPIVTSVVEAMQRAWNGIASPNKKRQIRYFRNPFKYVPMEKFADIADKMSRNEIMTPNEIRDVIGLVPSEDPKADKLMNSNMPQAPELQTDLDPAS